jgi:hypothetical protein
MPGEHHPRSHVQIRRQGCEVGQLLGELIQDGVLPWWRQRVVEIEVDLVRPNRLAQLADRAFVDLLQAGKVETGPPAGNMRPEVRARSIQVAAADPRATIWSPSTARVMVGGGSSEACSRFRTKDGSSP